MLINLPDSKKFNIEHISEENPSKSDFPMHAHSHFELLYFISGDVTYLVEGNCYHPKPNDIFIFNIAETHKVTVNSDKCYERIVIQFEREIFDSIYPSHDLFSAFSKRKLGQNNKVPYLKSGDALCRQCIARLVKANPLDAVEVISYLSPLLSEIKKGFYNTDEDEAPSLSSEIVRYVNRHIGETLYPEKIAKDFFISRTELYRLFKAATGSGIHEYIRVKRLIMAENLLKSGEKPLAVYEKCGFKNYSTFFRAYKSRFFVSPKEVCKRR